MRKGLIPVLSRYSIIGIASVLANNFILIAGDQLGVHYAVSTLVCFFLVGALAYLGHANVTFAAGHSIAGYARYCGTQGFGLCLTLAILFVMIDVLAWPIWIAAPLVSALMFVYTFIATRWAVTHGYSQSN